MREGDSVITYLSIGGSPDIGTDYSVYISDCGDPIILVTEVIMVTTINYKVYSRGLSTLLWLLVLNT